MWRVVCQRALERSRNETALFADEFSRRLPQARRVTFRRSLYPLRFYRRNALNKFPARRRGPQPPAPNHLQLSSQAILLKPQLPSALHFLRRTFRFQLFQKSQDTPLGRAASTPARGSLESRAPYAHCASRAEAVSSNKVRPSFSACFNLDRKRDAYATFLRLLPNPFLFPVFLLS